MSSSPVLIDTSAYYAIADPDVAHHNAATTIMTWLAGASARLFTTNFLVAETHALILIRRGYAPALRALQDIERSSTTLIRVSVKDEQRARAIIEQYDDKPFSFTDATSFAVMERPGIAHAFTFDHHFAQHGFTLLTPDYP